MRSLGLSSNRTYYKNLEEKKRVAQGRPLKERADPLRNHPELKTDVVFLIGNGESRLNFDLERLRGLGTTIGCNALYRDFAPDILTVIDATMIKEVDNSGYAQDHVVLLPANKQRSLRGSISWRTVGFNTCGCFNMKLAGEIIRAKRAYMIGMDAYRGNCYTNTPNYNEHGIANFDGIINRYIQVMHIPGNDTIYYNVNTQDAWGKRAHETGQYKFITYEEFEKHIKNNFN